MFYSLTCKVANLKIETVSRENAWRTSDNCSVIFLPCYYDFYNFSNKSAFAQRITATELFLVNAILRAFFA